MKITVQEAHDALAQLIEMGLGESELRLAYQPNYPLQDHVAGLWFDPELASPSVFVVSGGQVYDEPYAPRDAFIEATTAF